MTLSLGQCADRALTFFWLHEDARFDLKGSKEQESKAGFFAPTQ